MLVVIGRHQFITESLFGSIHYHNSGDGLTCLCAIGFITWQKARFLCIFAELDVHWVLQGFESQQATCPEFVSEPPCFVLWMVFVTFLRICHKKQQLMPLQDRGSISNVSNSKCKPVPSLCDQIWQTLVFWHGSAEFMCCNLFSRVCVGLVRDTEDGWCND